MLALNSERFLRLLSDLHELNGLLVGFRSDGSNVNMTITEDMRNGADEISILLEEMQLPVSLAASRRYRNCCDDDEVDGRRLETNLTHLSRTVQDEICLRHLLVLTASETALYKNVSPFGADVALNLSDTAADIEEAAKCMAVGRYTASVMHLARALEVTLQGVAKKINITFNASAGWDALLTAINNEINNWGYQTTDEVAKKDSYRQIHAHLSSVKNAWRHPSMHSRFTATEEVAMDIYNAVKGFMRHAAEVLK